MRRMNWPGGVNISAWLPAVLVFLALIIGAAPVSAQGAKPLQQITLHLNWMHQFEFAGFYVAKERGYYAAAGLDVDIRELTPDGDTDLVSSVLAGEGHYGVGYSSLIFDFHKERPVVALAAILQDSPLVLMTRDDPTIETPADLKGKRVMISGDALNATPIMALLSRHKLTRADIRPIAHSHNVDDLIAGRTDAITAYRTNEPFQMREKGAGYRLLDPKEWGLSFYGDFLFTSHDEVQLHPERTRAFVDASIRGWQEAFDDIDATVQLIRDKYNSQNKSAAALQFEGRALKALALKMGVDLGHIDLQRLARASDVYRLMGIKMSQRPLEEFIWSGAQVNQAGNIRLTPEEIIFIHSRTIKAATTTNWPPFAFADAETADPLGIGFDFWKHVADAVGLKFEVTNFDSFQAELDAVKEKRQDLIYSVGDTEARRAFALFTEPYARFPLAIATSKDENFIPDPSHLAGRKVAVGNGFTAHRMMAEAFPDLDYLPVANAREGLQAVTAGEAYAYIDIMPTLAYAINQYGFTNLKISGDTGLVFGLRFMIRKDYPQLRSIANKVIAAMPPGTKQQILNRWINVQYQQGIDYQRYLPYALAVLIAAALVFYWMFHAKQQAQRANRAKSEFLALMSHDLRTPLNAIMGFSDMIRSQALGPLGNPRYEEYAGDIHKSGTLLVNLINDILDLSKIEAGRYELADEPVDVEGLIEASISQCGILAHPARIEITSRIAAGLAPLRGDERVLTQILNNLISNAVKFSHEGAKVEVRAELNARGAIIISIVDTGIGMTQNELKRVMKPFEQANRNDVRRGEGTGLGLYLCQSLMGLLGGNMTITSEPGLGTTAILAFPPERTLTAAKAP